jgi:hypothetical protein
MPLFIHIAPYMHVAAFECNNAVVPRLTVAVIAVIAVIAVMAVMAVILVILVIAVIQSLRVNIPAGAPYVMGLQVQEPQYTAMEDNARPRLQSKR